MNGFTPVTAEAAEILAQRSLRQVDGGWQWQADQRLKAGSEFRLTRDEAMAFLQAIQAPTLCFLAEESPFADLRVYREMLPLIKDIDVHRLPGRHHLHLEGAEPAIAAGILRFLGVPSEQQIQHQQ
jgi:pimeloyl-ACP methyl ester carboxylesterase